MYSRFDWVSPETPVGKVTLIPFMCTWLKLTIMKLARRKNMMSIKGMISMRALWCGMGELTRIRQFLDSGRGRKRWRGRFADPYFPRCFGLGFQHKFQIRCTRLQFEL